MSSSVSSSSDSSLSPTSPTNPVAPTRTKSLSSNAHQVFADAKASQELKQIKMQLKEKIASQQSSQKQYPVQVNIAPKQLSDLSRSTSRSRDIPSPILHHKRPLHDVSTNLILGKIPPRTTTLNISQYAIVSYIWYI